MEDLAVAMAHASALRSIARVVEEKVDPTPADVAEARITEQVARGKVLVLSGAGVSTDSGLPDYRGPRGSLSRHRPMTTRSFAMIRRRCTGIGHAASSVGVTWMPLLRTVCTSCLPNGR